MSELTIDIDPDATKGKKQVKNPFPGLRPFKIDQSHLFFGREGQSDEVLVKLSKHRFVSIIGPSGSGKSSFIYCGVLPVLYGGFLANTSTNWEVTVARPGNGPIDNLAESILLRDASYVSSSEQEKKIKRKITSTLLRSSSLGLVEVLMQLNQGAGKNHLILIDQFEELFRFQDNHTSDSSNESLAFINLLVEACRYEGFPIYIAITLRSDFIGECTQFPDLTKKINESQYLIPQMTREQKKRAITGPVAVGQASISSKLVQRLLNDLGDKTDQLPILQHAMMRTWNYWVKNEADKNELIDIKHYEAIGTMSEALSMHANEAYEELDDTQKLICESLFKTITEKRDENIGIRRPTRLDEIAAIANVSNEAVIKVIDKFRDPGRSLLTPAYHVSLEANSIIDISHESLMRIWIRLKNWVDDEAEAVRMYLRLAEAGEMYQLGKGGLWRPPDLQLALNWEIKHRPTLVWGQRYHPTYERTMVFLEYSKKEFETEQRIKELRAKRRLRNARIFALILGGATVVSLMFLMFAFYQKTIAEKNENEAMKQRMLAEENLKIATEQKALAIKNEKEAKRSKNIADQKTIETQQALYDVELQRTRAEAGEAEAMQNAKQARVAQRQAEEQEIIATEQKENAEISKRAAERLRMLAIAKSMAIKSGKLSREQMTLKALLAQQAYIFNASYQGATHDNDIYNGLYYAIKEFDQSVVKMLTEHRASIRAMYTARRQNAIFSADNKGKIIKWKLNNETPLPEIISDAQANHLIRTIALTSDNTTLIAAGNYPKTEGKSYVEIFDLSNNSQRKLTGFDGDVWKVLTVPNNKAFIALDQMGRGIKYSDFEQVTVAKLTSARLNDVALTKNGEYLIGAGNDHFVYLYEVNNNFRESKLFENNNKILSVAVYQEDIIAIGDEFGIIKIFNLSGELNLRTFTGHTSPIEAIEFSSNGQFMASASRDKTVRLWNREDYNALPIKLEDHTDWVFSIAFKPDNSGIFVGTRNNIIKSWPTSVTLMTDKICSEIDRNMTQEEWETYVAKDIAYHKTCK